MQLGKLFFFYFSCRCANRYAKIKTFHSHPCTHIQCTNLLVSWHPHVVFFFIVSKSVWKCGMTGWLAGSKNHIITQCIFNSNQHQQQKLVKNDYFPFMEKEKLWNPRKSCGTVDGWSRTRAVWGKMMKFLSRMRFIIQLLRFSSTIINSEYEKHL